MRAGAGRSTSGPSWFLSSDPSPDTVHSLSALPYPSLVATGKAHEAGGRRRRGRRRPRAHRGDSRRVSNSPVTPCSRRIAASPAGTGRKPIPRRHCVAQSGGMSAPVDVASFNRPGFQFEPAAVFGHQLIDGRRILPGAESARLRPAPGGRSTPLVAASLQRSRLQNSSKASSASDSIGGSAMAWRTQSRTASSRRRLVASASAPSPVAPGRPGVPRSDFAHDDSTRVSWGDRSSTRPGMTCLTGRPPG